MRRYLVLSIALALALTLSLFTFFLTREWERTRALHALRGIASDRVFSIQEATKDAAAKLQYLRSFFFANTAGQQGDFEGFSRELESYIRSSLLADPATAIVAFLGRVDGSERAQFTAQMRRRGLTSFEITDEAAGGKRVAAPDRLRYFPVLVAEPVSRSLAWQGLDLWADPAYRATMQSAARADLPRATGPVQYQIGSQELLGIWAFVPLIVRTGSSDALLGKSPRLEGFFGIGFRVDRLVESAMTGLTPAGIDLVIYDTTGGGRSPLYVHPSRTRSEAGAPFKPDADRAPYRSVVTIDVLGRQWEIDAYPAPAFLRSHTYFLSWAVLGGGLLSTAVLAGFLFLSLRRTRRIERMIAERTEELSKEVRDHQAAEESLRVAHEDLTRRMETIDRRSREIELLSEMGDLLLTCQSLFEAYDVISQHAAQLFPRDSGSLFVFDDGHRFLERIASWGPEQLGESVFSPDACWGLRRGKAHIFQGGSEGALCRHLGKQATSSISYLCLPLSAQSETIGVLHVQRRRAPLRSTGEEAQPAVTFDEAKVRLAAATAEHAAMAIANLRLRESLRQQSIRDPLTALYNRRYMEESVDREIHRAARSGSSLAVIILDIDHFKSFNDSYGHEAGDLVLKSVGELLARSVRGEDIPCRFGGEEFVLILPGASMESALQKAEALRREVSALSVDYAGRTLPGLTISLGVSSLDGRIEGATALLNAADEALYRAKKGGRNRVEVASATS